MFSLFVEEVQDEVIITHGYHHHTEQRDVMPEIRAGPELHTHTERAAVPKDHDRKHDHEALDDFLGLFGGDERHQQKEIAEDRYYGYPTISTH